MFANLYKYFRHHHVVTGLSLVQLTIRIDGRAANMSRVWSSRVGIFNDRVKQCAVGCVWSVVWRAGERANGRKALLVTATCASCDCDCVSISVDVVGGFSVGGIAQW